MNQAYRDAVTKMEEMNVQAIQDRYRYLPEAALRRVCEVTDITPAAIAGVSTFYTQFRHKPVVKHIVQVCNGTACHVKSAELVHDAFSRELKVGENEDTSDARALGWFCFDGGLQTGQYIRRTAGWLQVLDPRHQVFAHCVDDGK